MHKSVPQRHRTLCHKDEILSGELNEKLCNVVAYTILYIKIIHSFIWHIIFNFGQNRST
jgi:hypothetical protein